MAAHLAPPGGHPVPPSSSPAEAGVPRSHRAPATVARKYFVIVLALCVVLSGLVGYLTVTTIKWQNHSQDMDSTSATLGTDLAQARTQLAGTTSELEAVRAQLLNAHNRIISLANEKAQVGDLSESRKQLLEYQLRITTAATDVTTKLGQCINGQQQIIAALTAQISPPASGSSPSASATPTTLAQLRLDVTKMCDDATAANQSLQKELTK